MSTTEVPAAPPRPNVLFIMVDQWPAHLLGCAGHPVIETPTIDRLAALGTRFARAYAECPICIPARRTVMTGLSPRGHGDRIYRARQPLPEDKPTLAQSFRAAGYQTAAIGKLHVHPLRTRIGFDEVLLAEDGEGGGLDDYELFLADRGQAGRRFAHGMGHNEYHWRPWHLPEELHVTNWVSETAARTIRRRDPTRPAFWYVSFPTPHPPLVPLATYFDRYRDREIDPPAQGSWLVEPDKLPYLLRAARQMRDPFGPQQIANARRAYYAQCTHIDHQLRLVLGTLREEGLLDDTVILFAADHGEMLGDHGIFGKRLMLEGAAAVPLILVDTAEGKRIAQGKVDRRPVGLQDIMPTLLDLCGIAVPESCEGLSLATEQRRRHLYGEWNRGVGSTRMMHDGRFKLIWYPAGNRFQLFDLDTDPRELVDLSTSEPHRLAEFASLLRALTKQLYGGDEKCFRDGKLYGIPEPKKTIVPSRDLNRQRGLHLPPPAVAEGDGG